MGYIFKKEVSAYFSTPFGFVFMGIFLLLSGLSFTIYNLVGLSGEVSGMFSLLSNLAFMVFPVLTMRLFAEERRAGTEQLLLNSRLSITDISVQIYFERFLFWLRGTDDFGQEIQSVGTMLQVDAEGVYG